jgi:hypothetical protein
MAELQTKPTNKSVDDFLDRLDDETRRDDCRVVLNMMREATGAEAVMWGPAIIGFGAYTFRYANGKEAQFPIAAFSPRKTDLTLYLSDVAAFPEIMSRLGKHKTSKACLYIKRLSDVNVDVLKELIVKTVETMEEQRVDRRK